MATVHLIVWFQGLLQVVPIFLLFLLVIRWIPIFLFWLVLTAWFLGHLVFAKVIFLCRWLVVAWSRTGCWWFFASPSSSLALFGFVCLFLVWSNWVLWCCLWFWYFCLRQWLWLNILYSVVLLMLRQVSNILWVFVLWLFLLLQPFSISESVDGVISWWWSGVDTSNHYDFWLFFT